jgi:tetratricopeptide (TPR) repeat protein
MHEHLRRYATEKLRQTPETYEQTLDLHCLIYFDFLRQQEPLLKGAELKAAQQSINADRDNVRAAWSWAVERNRWLEIKQVMTGLLFFYEAKGWYAEADEIFGRAVTKLRQLGETQTMIGQATRLAELRLILGLALVNKGWFQSRLGRFEEGQALLQESYAILQETGDSTPRELAYCRLLFGIVMCIVGEPAVATSLLRESLSPFKQVGDVWGRGTALSFWGQATLAMGQFEDAEHLLQKSLTLLNNIGNQLNVAYTMSALGHVSQVQNRIDQAELFHQDALRIRTEIGERTGLAFTFCDLGEVARLQEDRRRAKQYYEKSLALAQEIGLRAANAEALRGLGNLAEGGGDYVAAKQFFQESVAISPGRSLYTHSPSAVAGLGWAALGLGEYQPARQYFIQTLRLEAYTQRASITLDALVGLAHYLANADQQLNALEILALSLNHSACMHETRTRAIRLQAELETELSPETIAVVQARGKERTLDQVVAQFLAEEP